MNEAREHSAIPAPSAAIDPIWRILTGLGLFAFGILICGSIATFSPLENSWNVATDFPTQNLFGTLGAFISDTSLQSMGWGAWIGGVILCAGGMQRLLFFGRPNPRHWILSFLTLLAICCFFSVWPLPKSWPFIAGLGGVVGDIFRVWIAIPLKAALLPYPETLAAGISGLAAIHWLGMIFPKLIGWLKLGVSSLFGLTHQTGAIAMHQFWETYKRIQNTQNPQQTALGQENWQSNPLFNAIKHHHQGAPHAPSGYTEYPNREPSSAPQYSGGRRPGKGGTDLSTTIAGLIAKTKLARPDFISKLPNILKGQFQNSANPSERPVNNFAPGNAYAEEFDTPQSSDPVRKSQTTPAALADIPPAPGPAPTKAARKPAKRLTGVPAINLLDQPPETRSAIDEPALLRSAEQLSSVLKDFGVHGKITEIRPGPVVTLFELEPARGVKSARIIALADDIARSMETVSARMAVVPGKNAIGIELPNDNRETVYLRSLLEAPVYGKNTDRLPMALGEDIGGEPVVVNLAKMPHLLIAGTTGSGKSVGVNAMILSLIFRLPASECRFIMIDPKMLELSIYEGIPHLLCPVVTDPSKAVNALKWAVMEMESRYELMSKTSVRNLAAFNEKAAHYRAKGENLTREIPVGFDENGEQLIEEEILPTKHIPNIVIIIDEMADLMMVAGKDIEGCVQRLAQMARAAGIHLITATQRPSVDVITGTIKANFPTRISYMVTTKIDSRTILGEQGAEQLLGMGDLLYQAPGKRPQRLHGPFVSDREVEAVVDWLKKQGAPDYIEDILEGPDDGNSSAIMDAILGTPSGDKDEDLYNQAIAIVTQDNRASTSYLQRRLKVGYNKAAGLMDRLEEEGVISPANHAGKREVYGQTQKM